MKTGDLVKLHDGSYNMSLVKGELEHTPGIYHHCRCYRVLGLSGMYPTDRSHAALPGNIPQNDLMLVDVDDTNFVLFTQERFCGVVTPAPLTLPHLEVIVPRGTKIVHLIPK